MIRVLPLTFACLFCFAACSTIPASPASTGSGESGGGGAAQNAKTAAPADLPPGFEASVTSRLASLDLVGAIGEFDRVALAMPADPSAWAAGTELTLDRARTAIVSAADSVLFTIVSSPAATVAKKPFKGAFSVRASAADGTPLAGLPVRVDYPAFSADDPSAPAVTASLAAATDSAGIVTFTPEIPPRSVESSVVFSLALNSRDGELDAAIGLVSAGRSASLPFLAGTLNKAVPTSIAMLDYDKNGKAMGGMGVSATACLKPLVKMGFTRIGMADFPSQLASGDETALIAAAKKLFGSSVDRLIYGTTRVVSTAKGADGTWSATCASAVSVWNFKVGGKTWSGTAEATASGKTEAAAISAAREAVAGGVIPLKLYYNL